MEYKFFGAISEVEDSQNSATLNGLACFAVAQHNKNEKSAVEFVKVVNVKQRKGHGIMYYMTMEVKVGDKMNICEANIWWRSWMNLAEVMTFKLGGGGGDGGGSGGAEIKVGPSRVKRERKAPDWFKDYVITKPKKNASKKKTKPKRKN